MYYDRYRQSSLIKIKVERNLQLELRGSRIVAYGLGPVLVQTQVLVLQVIL